MNECNDPDHGAINAERSESRGLRKAWIELDDKRQQLERELAAVTEQRDEALSDLEFRRDLFKLQEQQLNDVRAERDELAEAARTLPDYDAGLLNDFGGGDAGWWQDYIRAEIGRANEYWRTALAAVKGGLQ
jgi:DNA repair exonuclease SbcCD ATPase subunit